jgi:type III secretion system YscJ/HrcJ family lipoprotein
VLKRWVSALLIGVICSGCAKETIAHLQEERAANRIKVLLLEQGIPVEKIRDEKSRELRFNVVVSEPNAGVALSILEKHNLPVTSAMGTAAIFQEGGIIPTNTQERAKREAGVEGDIENKLRGIPRVIYVAADVSIPEDNPLRDVNEAKPRPKAAVILGFQPDGDNRPPITSEDIQRYVQASLPELKSAEVSVLMTPWKPTERIGGLNAVAAANDGGQVAAVSMGDNACKKARVLGIDVCAAAKKSLITGIIIAIATAGLLSGMAVIAVLRAMRYRKDLHTLTAQVAQLRR